jgi:hypothetical protein
MGITKYPHTCTYNTQLTPPVWDSVAGGYTAGTAGNEVTEECRAKPSGSGKTVKRQDGVLVDYDYDLSFPMTADPIPVGTQITIKDADGVIIVSGALLSFFSVQRHRIGAV